jgi:hypothetical protein
MASCTHLDHVLITELPESVDGCEDCLREGTKWLHLRLCLECGHVGCCDNSPERHGTKHANESGHPIIRSVAPGVVWSGCFDQALALVTPPVTATTGIPPAPLL